MVHGITINLHSYRVVLFFLYLFLLELRGGLLECDRFISLDSDFKSIGAELLKLLVSSEA